jgi:hypothetical protein
MKVMYLAYGAAGIGMLALSHNDNVIISMALWGLLALWLGALMSVLLRLWWSDRLALAALLPVLAVLLIQSGKRIAFIINRGMDYSTSDDASTVMFLIGWAGELILLIPALLVYTRMLDGKPGWFTSEGS